MYSGRVKDNQIPAGTVADQKLAYSNDLLIYGYRANKSKKLLLAHESKQKERKSTQGSFLELVNRNYNHWKGINHNRKIEHQNRS